MIPEMDFYQISGYRAHSNGWFKQYDDKPMTKAIATERTMLFRPQGQDAPVELVLGILPSGASYLLMTSEQMLEFTHRHRLPPPRNPWRVDAFSSLSPIYFHSLQELSDKIATYKQRPRNKNRREFEAPQDNSQANRGYVKMGPDVVHHRAYFEHQRTLYRLLTGDLQPGKVGLASPPWLQSGVRVVSLVFGEWIVENRARNARLEDTRLVDVGWTDTSFPAFFERLTGTTIHLKLKSQVKNPESKTRKPCFSEVVEDDQAGLYLRLRNLLTHDANQIGIPLVVIVHDEDMARAVLLRAGIDVDTWPSGLSSLLPLSRAEDRYKQEYTDSPTPLPGPCIVDTQKLVNAVMETANLGRTLPESAKVLHMQTDTKTCAGDDGLLQLHMWLSMAQGFAIDEQHKERTAYQPGCAQLLAPPQDAAQDGNGDVDPNDVDPNDMPPAPRPTIEDDWSDDDDW